jgi:hypothetical protein
MTIYKVLLTTHYSLLTTHDKYITIQKRPPADVNKKRKDLAQGVFRGGLTL